MASTFLLSRRGYEPLPRLLHTSSRIGSRLLIHSGVTKDNSVKNKQRIASLVEIFDSHTKLWKQKKVTGETPVPGICSAASASINDDLLTFGGHDGSKYYNTLHKLKDTSQWLELCPQNKREDSPMAKIGAGMVAFGDSLVVMGGYGIPHGPIQPGSSFIRDTRRDDGRGWTNEFHTYNLIDDVWITPDISGERPPPCSGFSLTSIDNQRALLFGGWSAEKGMANDVYIIDLQSMHWTKIVKEEDTLWPEERSWHAACCLSYGQQHPQLLVTGGKNRQGEVLGDAWILDVDSRKWKKIEVALQPRFVHTTTAFCLVDGVTEVTIFGGSADPWAGSVLKHSKLADTTLLQFYCAGQSEWKLFSVGKYPERRSKERLSLRKSVEQERQEEEKVYVEQRMQDEARAYELQQRVQQAEATADELQRKLDEVEEREWERLAAQEQATAAEPTVPSIQGADIVAKTTLEVASGAPLSYEWRQHGLKLYIPEDAVKSDTPTMTMTIQASFHGQYQLPDDTELVSGIYWVAFPGRFSQPVTMELQHCAYLEHSDQPSSLFFITAKCNQKTLPYNFIPLPGGVFSANTSYGAIELNHFSGFGVARRKKKRKRYTGQIFYIPQATITTWLMHFTIICDLELCLKVVENFYSGKGAEVGPYLEVIFDGEEVSLDIPMQGINLPSGWSLQPLVYPMKLLRVSVDNYQPGHSIPACQVQLVWLKVEKLPKELSYMIHVTGVIPHDTHIRVTRNAVVQDAKYGSIPEIKKEEGKDARSNDEKKNGLQHTEANEIEEQEFMEELMSALYHTSVPNSWKILGVMLKLPLGPLNSIAAKYQQDPQKCMMAMFELWLKRLDPPPTWDAVIEAVQFLGEEKLALELREKHISR